MADSKKGKNGSKGAAKKAADEPRAEETSSERVAAEVAEKAEQKASRDEHDEHGERGPVATVAAAVAHAPHTPGAHAHGHKPNIKEYMVIFVALAALTALEVGVAKVPGVSHKAMGLTLVGLALTKAAIVALYYMHLKHETRILKMTVAVPMAAPTIYALVLITEAAWRLTRW